MTVPQHGLTELAGRIRSAIAQELKVSSAGLPFRVTGIQKYGGILTLELDSLDPRCSLDETMEDGRLNWKTDVTGSAEIVSVLPGISYLNAILTSGRPPRRDDIVFVNPARFLEPLLALWDRKQISDRAVDWYSQLEDNQHDPSIVPDHRQIKELRPAQRAAFQLTGWKTSYLWGPPGTGKTRTIGWLLASYLRHRPNDKVLFLSTMNVAVDLAVLAVDRAIPALFGTERPSCLRFGSRFDPKRYDKRDHLIPVRDKTLIDRYQQHLKSAPDPAEPEKYYQWRECLEGLRREIREQNRQYLETARLAAMTATHATFQHDDLAEVGPYDLVVFDEASQVGKAHAMTLAPLGKRVLFAGDPQQLSPIVRAKTEAVSYWLGKSAFDWADRTSLEKATWRLTEQWRMAAPISTVVSEFFYRSQLTVAIPALHDPEWLRQRTAQKTTLLEPHNVVLVNVRVRARTARKFLGYCCPESAEIAAALMVDLRMSCPDQNLLILTPYRAQRHEISKHIQSLNGRVSEVSTVHRAQGSERRIIIFDPVCPSSEFVAGPEGMRLVNVALSRAECRLIVLMQADWAGNPALRFLANKFPLTELDSTEVERLLNTKLSRHEKPTPAFKVTTKSAPQPATLIENFHQELLVGLLSCSNTAERRKQFLLDLAGRARYSNKLTYAEIDGAIAAISDKLPPLDCPH